MVSALADTNDIVTALRLGANDYVTKPVNVDVLHARMDTHLKMAEAVRMIRAQRDMLSALAAIDGLTGVYNRRTLDARLEEEIVRTRRYSHPLSALFMDLDHFKAVNDRLGHPAGDEALRLFAARAQDMLRASDALFRYGGEEFFALLPETKIDDALEVAERIRGSLETTPIPLAGIPTTLTVSIGVAELPAGFQGLAQDFVQLADKAMYEAKQAGRNCVRVAPIPPATGGSEGR
jgi:diguanylate cyclase (GGDEF)-like protein